MKYAMVPVKNVMRLSEAGGALINRSPGLPGMGLIHGPTGYGKSTAVTWFVNECHGVYVRAMAMWSPGTMLTAILKELDCTPRYFNCGIMVEQIVEHLALTRRPLFLDEADYLVENKRMVETLRDLHDMTAVPVILIGMAGIQRKIQIRQQLSGRIAQWVDFKPCDLEDAVMIAGDLCEVQIERPLLEQLQEQAGGSIRLLVVGLSHIEQTAKARGLKAIGLRDWGKRDFFFGEAPRSARPLKAVAA